MPVRDPPACPMLQNLLPPSVAPFNLVIAGLLRFMLVHMAGSLLPRGLLARSVCCTVCFASCGCSGFE
jgi:uncharacterized membrane protein